MALSPLGIPHFCHSKSMYARLYWTSVDSRELDVTGGTNGQRLTLGLELDFGMSRRVRYARLPTAQQDAEQEMEDAFEGSDDEHDESESRPMIRQRSPSPPVHFSANNISDPLSQSGAPLYDFEYDYPPPPGSPPRPSAFALPGNVFGNDNGYIPVFSGVRPVPRQGSWFTKTFGRWLPGRSIPAPSRPVGGGTQMDGVFANVVAKPSTTENPRALEAGTSNVHVVPEFEQNDVPPVCLLLPKSANDCSLELS